MRTTGRLLRLALLALASATLLGNARAQVPTQTAPAPLSDAVLRHSFELLPEDSWVIPAIAQLVHHGIAPGHDGAYPSWDGRHHTRYEAAVFTAQALERGEGSYPVEDLRRQGRLSPACLNYDADDIFTLKKLVTELMPELQGLGLKPSEATQALQHMAHTLRFSGVSPAFPDVPKTHWAFASVERLRTAGIVMGYEDGTFNSDVPK